MQIYLLDQVISLIFERLEIKKVMLIFTSPLIMLTSKTFLLGRLGILQRYLLRTMSLGTENNFTVIHNPAKNEFTIDLPPKLPEHPKSSQAILEYTWLKKNAVDLVHTGVPEHYQRKGIAKILAKKAFDHFLDTNTEMVISCTYLIKFVQDTNYRSLAETHCPPVK